jgi:branched-chain amino acid transport system substrate-binding protein
MVNTTRLSTINAAVISALALFLAACNPMPDTIKIGVAQPLTGNTGALGKDLANGVQMAVNEINKNGFKVNGKKVLLETVIVDDKSEPEEGKKVAASLIDAGVVAVIGHLNSNISILTAPMYAEKGIAQLSMSTSPKFTQLGHATTLRLLANDDMQARALGVYAATQIEGTKFAVLDDGSEFRKATASLVAKQLEGKKTIAIRESFDAKTKDFAALAEKLKTDGIQVAMVSTVNSSQVVDLIDALTKIGYGKSITIIGVNTLKNASMAKQAENVAQLLASSPLLEAGEFTAGQTYLSAYESAYKIPPAFGGHYTYDATYILADAIKKTGSADPAKITATLRKIDGYAPTIGSMKWTDTGEQRYGAVGIYTVKQGKWESITRSDNW